MGLSTKQVSGDHGLDSSHSLLQSGTLELPKPSLTRRQQGQQQQAEPNLECPRCGSANTKFCYYNNYNKSQPRHFCKACKRHWTKGGTLRNVPVGGGRKNKRLKASNIISNTATAAISASTASFCGSNVNISSKSQQRWQNLPVQFADQRNISDTLYRPLISPPSSVPFDVMNNINNSYNNTNFIGDNGNSTNTMESSSLVCSFETGLSSMLSSCQSSNAYNYLEKLETVEDTNHTTITTTHTVMPSTRCSNVSEPWHIPTMSTIVTDMPSYWNWNDIDSLVSADLNIPWDEAEIKP